MKRMQAFWRNFLTGFLIVLPAAITFVILQFLFGWGVEYVIDPVANLFARFGLSHLTMFFVRVSVAVGLVLLLVFLGFATHILVIKRLLSYGEKILLGLPVVGKIYGTVREISDHFGESERKIFRRVVLVEWPGPGLYTLGFVTSESSGNMVNVFIGTTPTPLTGFLIFVEKELLIPLDMSIEDALKLIVSGGIAGPHIKSLAQRKQNGHA